MDELVRSIARSLVDQPDQVQVNRLNDDDTVTIELRVAADDLGKVIGKQGRTARALRTVLAAAAARLEKKSRLEIIE